VTHTSRLRGTLLLLPALLPTLVVLTAGVTLAGMQSTGLMPVVGQPHPTLDAYRSLATDRALRDGLAVSLGVAGASTLLAVTIGLGVALLVISTRCAGRLLRVAAAATVPVPHLVGAAAFGLLLADSGLAARLLGLESGEFPPLVAGRWWIAVVAEYAWKESAFVALVVLAAVTQRVPELDEAAAVLGAGPWQRLRRVTLPLAAPAAIAAGGIAFAYVLGSYEVAWLLGRSYPEPLPVLAYRLYTGVDLTRRDQALAVALFTTSLSLASLAASAALLRRSPAAREGAGV